MRGLNLIYMILVIMAPLGYFYKRPFSYTLIVISWLALYPVLSFGYKIGPMYSLAPVIIYNFLIAGILKYKDMRECEDMEWRSKLKEKENVQEKVLEVLRELGAGESDIRDKELMVVKLYEITKKMSEGLRFDSIFNTFSAFLKDNLTFGKVELIILKEIDGNPTAERTYKVWGTGGQQHHKPDADYVDIVKLFSESKDKLYFKREKGADTLKYAAIPLLSENKIVGIMSVDDLPDKDLERFSILAAQFALEIKKVLLYETVEELAITDGLTGLYVRRYFFERLDEELKRSKRYKFKFAFLMIDIDDFKSCNDTYGHLVGDVVLKGLSRIIKESVREIDLVARYGGEEFSLVLPETGRDEACQVGERIRKKIEEHIFRAYDEKLKITISVGVSIYPDDEDDIKSLVDKADKALYKAKNSGKNIVCVCEK